MLPVALDVFVEEAIILLPVQLLSMATESAGTLDRVKVRFMLFACVGLTIEFMGRWCCHNRFGGLDSSYSSCYSNESGVSVYSYREGWKLEVDAIFIGLAGGHVEFISCSACSASSSASAAHINLLTPEKV